MKRYSSLIAILLLCLASPAARAQSVIEGRVTDNAGRPVPDADVLLEFSGAQQHRVTDAAGTFRFLGLAPGEYEITVAAQGYYSAEYELVVKPREPVVVQIELSPRTVVREQVEVRSAQISSGETGSSRLLIHSELDSLPAPVIRDIPTLALYSFPGATLSHDNFVHVRGNEVSLQEFVNGVSFLENPQQQFSPGLSPMMFETVNMISGSFPAEYGNRFGGVLDITTRSGRDLKGHGSVQAGAGTFRDRDIATEYGGTFGKLGYYLFGNGFTSDWYLNPPEPRQWHDFGGGVRSGGQLDYQRDKDSLKLFAMGAGTDFQLPNLAEDQEEGRNAARWLRSQTGILTWQHTFSPQALLSTSVYERTVGDHLRPTRDPVTPYGAGSRSSLTAGVKSDLVYARQTHVFKAGIDLTRLRLLESFAFDARETPLPPEDPAPFTFRGKSWGGQAGLYAQDHIALTANLAADLGVRWDYFDLINSFQQVSPRLALAYHFPNTRTTVHGAYNRYFSPHPLEFALLADHFGTSAADPGERVGPVQPYRQHYFELGMNRELHPKVSMEINAFYHRGKTPFEYREISITRLFLPFNSSRSRSEGVEFGLNLKPLEKLGVAARIQYAYQRTWFYGPLAGGYGLGEEVEPGQKFSPAFDEPHSGTASLIYQRKWRDFRGGFNLRYGSGTAAGLGAVRLPSHTTADLTGGFNLWKTEHRSLDFEFNLSNLSDNRYQIAKESEETPIQYASPRIASGRLKFGF